MDNSIPENPNLPSPDVPDPETIMALHRQWLDTSDPARRALLRQQIDAAIAARRAAWREVHAAHRHALEAAQDALEAFIYYGQRPPPHEEDRGYS